MVSTKNLNSKEEEEDEISTGTGVGTGIIVDVMMIGFAVVAADLALGTGHTVVVAIQVVSIGLVAVINGDTEQIQSSTLYDNKIMNIC
jgi:hypothetical protein